jgi:hypothetical protein
MYVEHLTPVSSEHLISYELLSLISTAGQTSRVFLAHVIPWINKASLALYIARIVQRATTDRSEVWKLYCAVELVPVAEASKFVTIEVESRSQTPSLRLKRRHAALVHCVRTILTTFYHMHYYHYAATGDVVKRFIYLYIYQGDYPHPKWKKNLLILYM